MRTLLCALIVVISSALVSAASMDTVFEWRFVDYLWSSEAEREEAIKNGTYDFSRILPMDVDKAADGRVFISLLGREGVPATLTTVTDRAGPSGPLVRPYPDWSWFKRGDCNSLTNVYRIAIDDCNRLWVLDTGFLEGAVIECEAQLVIFDLNTDVMIRRLKIPNDVARGKSGQTLLATPIVETEGPYCENTTVFIADTMGEGLIVWNGEEIFRLESPLFLHEEESKNVTVANLTMSMAGGIVGMDVSPRIFPGELRLLYFHPLASFNLYSAPTRWLRTGGEGVNFQGAEKVLSSQGLAQAFSSEGTLFIGMTRETGIACWNRYRGLTRTNIELVAQDSERIQYPNGVKVIPAGPLQAEEELWIVSNRFIAYQQGRLSADDVNFRVLKSPVKRLIAGTGCEMPQETQFALQQIKGDRLIVQD